MLAILTLCLIFSLCGLALGISSKVLRVKGNPLAEQLNHLLPQTQCAQCGFPGCKPYAEAISKGEADINLCPPGGDELIKTLAGLLGKDPLPLADGLSSHSKPMVAFIEEKNCIGCALCLPACPVDAIIGAPRFLHTVIVEECTGCELCIAPCPVDCIVLVPQETHSQARIVFSGGDIA